MREIRVYDKEKFIKEKIDEQFFEDCKNTMCIRENENELTILLPGLCKLLVHDDSIDFYDTSKELLNIYKGKIIDEYKKAYLDRLRI